MNAFYAHHQIALPCTMRVSTVSWWTRALWDWISTGYEKWMQEQIQSSQCPLLEDPKERRDEFMEPYFVSAQPDQIVGIIKAREPVRIMTSVGKQGKSSHLE